MPGPVVGVLLLSALLEYFVGEELRRCPIKDWRYSRAAAATTVVIFLYARKRSVFCDFEGSRRGAGGIRAVLRSWRCFESAAADC